MIPAAPLTEHLQKPDSPIFSFSFTFNRASYTQCIIINELRTIEVLVMKLGALLSFKA